MYSVETYDGDLINNDKLLSTTSAEEFVRSLSEFAANHRAVNHPFLMKLERGELPNIFEALKLYAYQYSFYSKDFTNYLSGVIGCLDSEEHKELLLENLSEENGDIHDFDGLPAWLLEKIENVPHSELFGWFQEAMGINDEYKATHKPLDVVIEYKTNFTKLCYTNAAVGVGAIGLSTEQIVPKVYSHILKAVVEYTDLTEEQRVFFDLHGMADIKHSNQIMMIANDLATDEINRKYMALGVEEALRLREKFWDVLLEKSEEMNK